MSVVRSNEVIGETIGHFKIVSRLGRGGMGEVFLAEQQSIGTKVAIKLLQPDISSDAEHVQRFFNEARAVSRIQHAGICKIFDVGFHEATGQAYLIMEYLEGESLTRRIARTGRVGRVELADIGRQIASVLDATHSAGITHRDLKPDNVFVVPDRELPSGERIKVLDFGIAKLTGTLAAVSPRTTGTMGTPAYMAPEQWGDASKVDGRADIYSLGCLAFEMACGRPPFLVTNIAEACAKHLHDPPPRVRSLEPALPRSLDALIDRLLAKAPADRPQSLRAIAQAFEAIGVGANEIALAPTVSTGKIPQAPRRSIAPLVAGAGVLVAITGGALYMFGKSSTSTVPSASPVRVAVAPPIDSAPPSPDAAIDAPAADASMPDAAPTPKRVVVHRPPAAPKSPVEGTVDASEVRRLVNEQSAELQSCLKTSVKHGGQPKGTLDVYFTIELDGHVRVIEAGGMSGSIGACVSQLVRSTAFPRPTGGPAPVYFPFSFEATPGP
ncbi:MAG: serine/threonine protein kinase [Myxococcales bacterium]|nr:serine/threonine protein kinase [Myxococcales bacterium]